MEMATLLAPFGAEVNALVAELRRSVVLIESGQGHGAGVLWSADGLVVTNDHVVGRAQPTYPITLANEQVVPGRLLARDPGNDLALLEIPPVELPAIVPGETDTLRVGEMLIAVGHPFGVRDTATLGIVSGVGARLRLGRTAREVLQADIELAPGNSGGPLADIQGRVVGIASMIVSPGIAIAVPIPVVRRFVQRARSGLRAA